MPPKKRTNKKQVSNKAPASPASRPTTAQRFDEIEHLLQSMQGGNASSSTKKKGAAAASSNPSVQTGSKQRRKQKQSAETGDVIEEEDFQSQFTAGPAGDSSLSDDLETSAFLEQFKTLAAQKKKVEATRTARVNKRTITDMEHLGKELKVLTSQEIGVLTKGLLEETAKKEKEIAQFASEAKKYETESKRVRVGVETGLKEMLGEATKFSRRMDALGKDYAQRCKDIDAKMNAELDKEHQRIERTMGKRAKMDRRLQNVIQFLRTQERHERY